MSPMRFSQAPPPALKWRFPTFYYRTFSFCCLTFFSLLKASKHPPFNWVLNLKSILMRKSILMEKYSTSKKIPSFGDSPIFFHTGTLHPKAVCSFNRPWYSSLNGIRDFMELFIKNSFFWESPHFPAFETPKNNPPKNYKQFQRFSTFPHPLKQVQERDEPSF